MPTPTPTPSKQQVLVQRQASPQGSQSVYTFPLSPDRQGQRLEREKKQQQQQQLQLSGARKKRSWRCRLAAQWEREERRAMVGGCVSGGGDGAAEGTLARWRRAAAKRIGLSCASFFSYAASPSPPPPSKTVCASLSLSLTHTHTLTLSPVLLPRILGALGQLFLAKRVQESAHFYRIVRSHKTCCISFSGWVLSVLSSS